MSTLKEKPFINMISLKRNPLRNINLYKSQN